MLRSYTEAQFKLNLLTGRRSVKFELQLFFHLKDSIKKTQSQIWLSNQYLQRKEKRAVFIFLTMRIHFILIQARTPCHTQ